MIELLSPKVTIGLPTFNRKAYLKVALESALAQTYQNLEIVVSDNASTDGTGPYLAELHDSRLLVLSQKSNIGGIPNLNACLQHATGELFLLLSDDDLLQPDAIERLAAPFFKASVNAQPQDVGLTWCNCRIINSDGKGKWNTLSGPAVERPVEFLKALFSGKRGPRLSSVMIRTNDARGAGGYKLDRYNAMCDTANWGAACLCYAKIVCIGEPLVSYRVHPASHTGSSLASDWQRWGGFMHDDLLALVRKTASWADVKNFTNSRNRLLANLTVDVMMRNIGAPGWIGRTLREAWSSRRFLFSAYTAKRLLRDGWKLLK